MLGYDGGDGSAGCSSAPPTLGAPQSLHTQYYLTKSNIFVMPNYPGKRTIIHCKLHIIFLFLILDLFDF